MYPVQCTVQVQYAGPVTSARTVSMKTLPVNWLLTLGDQATGVLAVPFLRYRSTRITVALVGLFIYPVSTPDRCANLLFRAAPCRAFLPMLARGFVVEGMVGSYRIPPIVGTKVNRAVPPVTERDFRVCCGLGANVRSPISRCRDNRASERRAHPIPPTARIGIAAHSCIRWLAARAHCTRRPLTIMLHVAWCLDPARA